MVDYSPLWISLKVAAVATVITFFLGLMSAWLVLKMKKGRAVVDGLLSLPMVLPLSLIHI